MAAAEPSAGGADVAADVDARDPEAAATVCVEKEEAALPVVGMGVGAEMPADELRAEERSPGANLKSAAISREEEEEKGVDIDAVGEPQLQAADLEAEDPKRDASVDSDA